MIMMEHYANSYRPTGRLLDLVSIPRRSARARKLKNGWINTWESESGLWIRVLLCWVLARILRERGEMNRLDGANGVGGYWRAI